MEDPRRIRLTEICAALPEAAREYSGQHVTWRVGKRTFAYFLDDHHGDGIVAVVCKVAPGLGEVLVAEEPGRFYRPAYIGSRGWAGLRLDAGDIDWAEVADLVADSYVLVAPKRLAALVEDVGRS